MTWWKPSWWSSAMSWCALPPVNSSAWSCCYQHPVKKGVITIGNVSSSSLSSRSIIIQLIKRNLKKMSLTSSSSFFSPWNLTTKRLTPYSGRLSHALSIHRVMKIPIHNNQEICRLKAKVTFWSSSWLLGGWGPSHWRAPPGSSDAAENKVFFKKNYFQWYFLNCVVWSYQNPNYLGLHLPREPWCDIVLGVDLNCVWVDCRRWGRRLKNTDKLKMVHNVKSGEIQLRLVQISMQNYSDWYLHWQEGLDGVHLCVVAGY